ncbi:homoserine kinase [Ligilactobacillus salitolerans]|uniref:Homoserine kinase n=1 Tax=Ligilactobacillus salitolerans TaxID=1808352 RepID=A0A401IQT0_9LACO|nr:homoserine kinase [Ligilactobacillus salitolerans]GBG93854.1 homoserine kinase [Ligilactobacillus salitolerans]
MIKVKVPATSANLGVGFDCMGLAVSLYSEFYFEENPAGLEINGCPSEYQNEHNLVYQAFVKGCKYLDEPVPSIKLTIASQVPVARGLGSSAVCITAGLKAAGVWFNNALSKEEILKLAIEMEGHPDNVTPSIYGGLCVTFLDDEAGEPVLAQYEVSESLKFAALIPDYPISTKEARAVLPTTMNYATAIHQVSRCTIMARALETGDDRLLHQTCHDLIHEPYRAKLIPEYGQAKKMTEAFHGTMYISGSGSTLMAIMPDQEAADFFVAEAQAAFPQWKINEVAIDHDGLQSEVIERGEVLYR